MSLKFIKIFEILLKDKQIQLSGDHKLLSNDKKKGKKYWKYHNMLIHFTNNYINFKNVIQEAIEEWKVGIWRETNKSMQESFPQSGDICWANYDS